MTCSGALQQRRILDSGSASRRVTRPPVPTEPRVSRQQDENENPRHNEQAKHLVTQKDRGLANRVSSNPCDERDSSMPSKDDGSLRAVFDSSIRSLRQPRQTRCPCSRCPATTAWPCSRSRGGRSE